MNTKSLEKFAQFARRQLHSQVGAQLDRVLNTDSADLRAKAATVRQLQRLVRDEGKATVVERVAYTWFNRFCALRYMDVNRYTPVGIVSPQPGAFQPAILEEAKAGIIEPLVADVVDERAILDLLGGRTPSPDAQGEAYRLLLVGACNAYHDSMPFLFAEIDNYSELLMPDDLLSGNSILAYAREALTPEACENVEVIGWLYQFYISEKKDAVIGSKSKIEAADIPAATQLFTPHWIVRYLVENSLGRLWLATHPHSRLAEQMAYYISPTSDHSPLTIDNLPFTIDHSPQSLRLCDPAAGSGHMLTYAFDLLYAIYAEEGYTPSEIPTLILRHNLYGMEIDERAGALAAFALTMKARSRDRGFFNRGVHPNICVLKPITISTEEVDGLPWLQALAATLDGLPIRDALLADLSGVAQLDNIGSLLRPQLTREQIAQLRAAMTAGSDLFTQALHDKLTAVLDQLEYLARTYHVVVANPPYMGGNANDELKDFARTEYPDSKSDLFAMFIERNLDLARRHGLVAMITMQSWMFLSSYEKLRTKLLEEDTILSMAHLGARAFDTIGGEVVSTTAFVLEHAHHPTFKGDYWRLIDGNSEAAKAALFQTNKPVASGEQPALFYRAAAADFKKIPGSPIAYWVSDRLIQSFAEQKPLGKSITLKSGMSTTNNALFLRLWYEIKLSDFATDCDSLIEAKESRKRWFPYVKGGPFRRWYGNLDYVVNWKNDGEDIKAFVVNNPRDPNTTHWSRRIFNTEYFFRPLLAWTRISSGNFSVRYYPAGTIFSDASNGGFGANETLHAAVLFLNTKIVNRILAIISPTLNFYSGDIEKIPFASPEQSIQPSNSLLSLSRTDWDSQETSWDFTTLPLLDPTFRGPTLAATYATLRAHWQAMTDEMQQLEEANNRLFIDAYGLQDELTPDVPLAEITLTCNPHYRYAGNRTAAELEALLRADTMREFISYAVGCLFGRYSLDKPGLILANQGETVGAFVGKVAGETVGRSDGRAVMADPPSTVPLSHRPTDTLSLLPDADNVIPILDEGDWFVDDLCARVQGFLRLTFGEKNYAENLRFIEEALGRDLRGYLLRDFYNDHVRRYQKRPIYWLFSSPSGSFNALIYLHRYRPDTPSVVLNDYLREFRTKLTAERDHQGVIAIDESAPARERTRAQKQLDRFAKILAELQEYEDDVLYPLATQQIALDLDDGVKVNYNKLGKALKKVSGLSE